MDVTIRPAREDDTKAIAAFTTDTFEWGDYVADALPFWLGSDDGAVMVAADENDNAVALGRAEMMSPTEMWLQGARVSEEWRRRGIASAIGQALVDWAVGRGARIARLLTEGWNEPAQRQVEATGFRRVSDWVVGARPIDRAEPVSNGNGGRRARARRKLAQTHSSEAIPAWVSWRSGPLVQPSRGLHVDGWRWAQLSVDHLIAAAKRGDLWASQAGWVVTRRDDGTLYVEWLECGPDDIGDMIKSIVDLAQETGADYLRVTMPDVGWAVAAMEANGLESHPMHLYERPL